jgi:hypothetical protein
MSYSVRNDGWFCPHCRAFVRYGEPHNCPNSTAGAGYLNWAPTSWQQRAELFERALKRAHSEICKHGAGDEKTDAECLDMVETIIANALYGRLEDWQDL